MPNHENPSIRARELLEALNIKAPPVPLEKIAKLLNAQVRFAPFDDELSGMVYIKNGVPIIGVNALHHPNRQRFTMAHEFGHLVLHKDMITSNVHVDKNFPVLMRHSNSAIGMEQVEIEANQFAAELLMPSHLIEAALAMEQFDIDDEKPIEDLARKFRVSKQALEYRIRNRDHSN